MKVVKLVVGGVVLVGAAAIGTTWFVGRDGLTAESSRLAAVMMVGNWVEADLVFDDESKWSGSGVVISDVEGKLLIMTNSHCLNLPAIADQIETPDIKIYKLAVMVGSGGPVTVARFAETPADSLDLALLEVPVGGLRRGIDYEVADICDHKMARQGCRVVAIGSPMGLRGSESLGVVSAVREELAAYPIIQTDAAINHGNSGGPLFLDEDGTRHLVGINTYILEGAPGIGFAFCADEFAKREWKWFPATPAGAVEALKEIYKRPANVAN